MAGIILPCKDILGILLYAMQNLTGSVLFGKCYLWNGRHKNIVNLRRQSNGVEQSNMRNLEKINIPQLSQAGDIKNYLLLSFECRSNWNLEMLDFEERAKPGVLR